MGEPREAVGCRDLDYECMHILMIGLPRRAVDTSQYH